MALNGVPMRIWVGTPASLRQYAKKVHNVSNGPRRTYFLTYTRYEKELVEQYYQSILSLVLFFIKGSKRSEHQILLFLRPLKKKHHQNMFVILLVLSLEEQCNHGYLFLYTTRIPKNWKEKGNLWRYLYPRWRPIENDSHSVHQTTRPFLGFFPATIRNRAVWLTLGFWRGCFPKASKKRKHTTPNVPSRGFLIEGNGRCVGK